MAMTVVIEAKLTIGLLADRSGCNVPTIRYYEEIGLLPKAQRRLFERGPGPIDVHSALSGLRVLD